MAILPDKIVKLREFMALRKKNRKDEPPPEVQPDDGKEPGKGESQDAGKKSSNAKLYLASTLIPMALAYVIFSDFEESFWTETTIECTPLANLVTLKGQLTSEGTGIATSSRLYSEGSLAGKGATWIQDAVNSVEISSLDNLKGNRVGRFLLRVASNQEEVSSLWPGALVAEYNAQHQEVPESHPSTAQMMYRTQIQEVLQQIERTKQEKETVAGSLSSQVNQDVPLAAYQAIANFYDELFRKADATVSAIRNEPFSITDRMLIIYSFYKGNKLEKASLAASPSNSPTTHRTNFIQQQRFPDFGEGIFKQFFKEANVLEAAKQRHKQIMAAVGADAAETVTAKEYHDNKETLVNEIHEEALMSLLADHTYLQEGLTRATNDLNTASQHISRKEVFRQKAAEYDATIARLEEAKKTLEASLASAVSPAPETKPPLEIIKTTSGSENISTPLLTLSLITGGAGFAGLLFAVVMTALQGLSRKAKEEASGEKGTESEPVVDEPEVIDMPQPRPKIDPAAGKDVIEAETLEEVSTEEETFDPLDFEFEEEEPFTPDPGD